MGMLSSLFATSLKVFCCLAATNLAISASQTEDCGDPATAMKQPWRVGQAVVFKTQGLAVDADGAPNSYLVDAKGLSDTCDGAVAIVDGKHVTPTTDPHNWYPICKAAWADAVATNDFSKVAIFGFLTDSKNHPIVQSSGDPLPEKAYITTTTLTVPGTPDRVQRHWVDAVKIPYVVIPTSEFRSKYNSRPGDVVAIYRPKTSALAFAVSGDCCGLGEGSVKLHRDLGNEPIVNQNGVDRAKRGIGDVVLTVVFPGVNVPGSLDADEWNKSIQSKGNAALGGLGTESWRIRRIRDGELWNGKRNWDVRSQKLFFI